MSENKRKITKNMTEACYQIARNIYPDKEKIKDAAKSITEQTGMNCGSAKGYIKDFFLMMEGGKLTWAMAEKDARHYFEHIYADYGSAGLKKAINSLQLYLLYDKQSHPSLQKSINEFTEKYFNQ